MKGKRLRVGNPRKSRLIGLDNGTEFDVETKSITQGTMHAPTVCSSRIPRNLMMVCVHDVDSERSQGCSCHDVVLCVIWLHEKPLNPREGV
jgi:hypothetical protein